MIGWDEHERFPSADLPGQARQALANVRAVLAEDGAAPGAHRAHDLVRHRPRRVPARARAIRATAS